MSKRTCAVEGCGKKVLSRGWCSAHYWRWKRTGTTRDAEVLPQALALEAERFWAKVSLPGGQFGCMEWTGALSTNGYGQFWERDRMLAAHRWSYETLVGPVPDGLEVDHLCGNRACVRPDHLEPVTHRENLRRRGRVRVGRDGGSA